MNQIDEVKGYLDEIDFLLKATFKELEEENYDQVSIGISMIISTVARAKTVLQK